VALLLLALRPQDQEIHDRENEDEGKELNHKIATATAGCTEHP
jgi:hypothetical protein